MLKSLKSGVRSLNNRQLPNAQHQPNRTENSLLTTHNSQLNQWKYTITLN